MERDPAKPGPAAAGHIEAMRPGNGTQAQRMKQAQARREPIPGPVPGDRPRREILHEALEAARAEHQAQAQRLEEARAQLRAIADRFETGRSQRQVLRESAVARMQARLESLPMIEQAKGIVMAQQRCGPEEASWLLRQAAQRASVKISVLAAQIVAHIASPAPGNSAIPARDRSREPPA